MAKIHRFPWATGSDVQIWIVHFGSKSTPMIAQLCREVCMRSRIVKAEDFATEWGRKSVTPKLVILSGGDQSVYDKDAPTILRAAYRSVRSQCVILGICYGAQLLAQLEEGTVRRAEKPEFSTGIQVTCERAFGEYRGGKATMNHRDEIVALPEGWHVVASTERCRHAFVRSADSRILAVQFHPEMDHTEDGEKILAHAAALAGCNPDYTFDPDAFQSECARWMKDAIGGRTAICGLSGGVDSAVAFSAGRKAIGTRLRGIYVNNGWMREGETDEVLNTFGTEGISYVDASDAFYRAIERVKYHSFVSKVIWLVDQWLPRGLRLPHHSPYHRTQIEGAYYEKVRKAIGHQFIETFLQESRRLQASPEGITLVQGTNVADIIESETGLKAHHNVGGLPKKLGADIVEPLAWLYKFEIRDLALHYCLPMSVAYRQPFPGPGLSIRGWGRLARDDAKPLGHANRILEEVMDAHYPNVRDRPCQYYVALLKEPRVGIMGDARVMGYAWWLRMVTSRRRESYATLGVFPPTVAFEEESVHRLTSETQMPDGTPFVTVVYEKVGKPTSSTEPK